MIRKGDKLKVKWPFTFIGEEFLSDLHVARIKECIWDNKRIVEAEKDEVANESIGNFVIVSYISSEEDDPVNYVTIKTEYIEKVLQQVKYKDAETGELKQGCIIGDPIKDGMDTFVKIQMDDDLRETKWVNTKHICDKIEKTPKQKQGVVTCEFMPKSNSDRKSKDVKDKSATVSSVIYDKNGFETVLLDTEDKRTITFDVYTNSERGGFCITARDKFVYRDVNRWNNEMAWNEPLNEEQRSEAEPAGVKNDFKDDKLRWDLLPMEEIEDIVRVYHAGAKKYGPNNWQNLDNGFERYRAAAARHLMEYLKGERVDADTGCLHLAQYAWNAIAMLWYDKHGKGLINDENNNGK